jgi:hypothetical protein
MQALRESRDEVQDLTDVSSALSLDPVSNENADAATDTLESPAINSQADSEKPAP